MPSVVKIAGPRLCVWLRVPSGSYGVRPRSSPMWLAERVAADFAGT